MADMIRRPAFGQHVSVGALYNARNDQFLHVDLLRAHSSRQIVEYFQKSESSVTFVPGDNHGTRYKALDLPHFMIGSCLAEPISLRGTACYLRDSLDGQYEHAVVCHRYITSTQELKLRHQNLAQHLDLSALCDSDEATHVVTGVEWGCVSLIAMRVYTEGLAEPESINAQAKAAISTFVSALQDPPANQSPHDRRMPAFPQDWQTEIMAYSEMFTVSEAGVLLKDLQEAFDFLKLMPTHCEATRDALGWPVSYTLTSKQSLCQHLRITVPQERPYWSPDAQLIDSAVAIQDRFLATERKLRWRRATLYTHSQYLPPGTRDELQERIDRLAANANRFADEFVEALAAARSGRGDLSLIAQVLQNYDLGELAPESLGDFKAFGRKLLSFVQRAVDHGAVYVGYNGRSLDGILRNSAGQETFVCFFNAATMKNSTPAVSTTRAQNAALQQDRTWQQVEELLFKLLDQVKQATGSKVVIVDCDAISKPISNPTIAQYQDGREVVSDLLRFMEDKGFADCDTNKLQTDENIKPPIQRRHVTIACPGPQCSVAKVKEWLCPRCMEPVEFGYTDDYIYCACGRSHYSNYRFKCSSETHGASYISCDTKKLLALLKGLDQTNYLNILILGETGVGKSTFINALVNYLEYETLDDAIAADKLNYVIPCSFATQVMDRTDPNKPIEEKFIKVGSRADEHDGSKGDSATQKTTVYPVTFYTDESTLTVRLIDTPGIGDSRGVDADKANMADILSTLSGYETVHGILILLKSNNSRFTITFRYCIKELLTHLHSKAVANMVFGFTNTRISNYTPGDTFGPLKRLLDDNPVAGLSLRGGTTYCFDSESFRYLAACKNGVSMPDKVDFDRSWQKSRDETRRMIKYFQQVPPHDVKSTMSLHGARQLIAELTKPLAEITQLINSNIQINLDGVAALQDRKLKGTALMNALNIQKIQMDAKPLPKPRTVCGDKSCVDVRDDGKGQNNMVIVYKQHCHSECYLSDVQVEVMAHPSLIGCAAFAGQQNCQKCGHNWQQHLHVIYELHEKTVTMVDPGVQKQLATHEDETTLAKKAIQTKKRLIAEYTEEQDKIRAAAAKFCVFLKQNSLSAYNDALIEYLDHLIKEERAKIHAGSQNTKRLKSLEDERRKHQEAIEVITRNLSLNPSQHSLTERDIDEMVQKLYKLKHFGAQLKDLKQNISRAHQATYREIRYTVRRPMQSSVLGGLRQWSARNYASDPQSSSYTTHVSSAQGQFAVPGSYYDPSTSAQHRNVLVRKKPEPRDNGGFTGLFKRWV